MNPTRWEVVSLRKSAALLQQAWEALQSGASLGLPSECGYFALGPNSELAGPSIWLAHQPPELETIPLQAAAQLAWPGPWQLGLDLGAGKQFWQIPAHPLAQAFLALSGPVAARWVGIPWGQGQLVWKEPCSGLKIQRVDCACRPWRWLSGDREQRRSLEWVTGMATLLSTF